MFMVILSGISINVTGQVETFDDQLEKSVEILDDDNVSAELIEDLVIICENPVNLNNTNEEQINSIPYLDPPHRKSLLDYLSAYGEVFTIYELLSIPGYDSVLIQKIQPFITILPFSDIPALTPKNLIRFGHHDLILRYEQAFPRSMGYQSDDSLTSIKPDSYYLGSPQRFYFRYTYSWFDKIRIGIAGEKDPGEQLFRGAQSWGMDFYAAYVSISNIGILKNLTIGNFRVAYGQGLTMGSGLSLGSVPGFSTNVSLVNGIRPGLGMSEGSYLRGLSATIKIKRVEFSGFASYHPRDATITRLDSSSSIAEEISSMTTSGYHRTAKENEKRNALMEMVCGGNINFSKAPNQQFGFKTGLTVIYNRYSADLVPKFNPYNQFEFQGNQNINTGVDIQIRYRGNYFFGEVSRSRNRGMAWIAGVILTPEPRVCITLIYRNYQATYQNLFSNAFGQNSRNANERGIYVAVNAAVHPKFNLSGYLDLFTFPWLKYRVDSPSHGAEFGAWGIWQTTKNVSIGIRYFQKNTQRNGPGIPDLAIRKLIDLNTKSYRFNIDWVLDSRLVLKTRIEVKDVRESASLRTYGFLVYQEAQLKTLKWLESITLRFALFDIPAYASRIYVYEPEVLYGYSVPAYQGKGTRACLVMKFGIAKSVNLWLRGGITHYTDRNSIGTGLDLTEGNVRGELTGQMLIRL